MPRSPHLPQRLRRRYLQGEAGRASGSRAGLLVAVAVHVDEAEGLEAELRRVFAAPTAAELLDRTAALQAAYNPRIAATADALEAAARTDAAAAAAWRNRMDSRRAGCREVVRRLSAEGVLAEWLTEEEAVDLLWTCILMSNWKALVLERGWSAERYADRIGSALRRLLLR